MGKGRGRATLLRRNFGGGKENEKKLGGSIRKKEQSENQSSNGEAMIDPDSDVASERVPSQQSGVKKGETEPVQRYSDKPKLGG